MFRLLAISAYHLVTSQDEMTQEGGGKNQIHRAQATKLASEFFVGFSTITNDDTNTTIDAFHDVSNAGIKIRSILNCIQLTLKGFNMSHEITHCTENLSQLQSLLGDIRNSVSSGMEEDPESQRALCNNSSPENDSRTVMLLSHIDMLPYRMAEIFVKPHHEQDAPAIIHAIGTLSKCYIRSLESDYLSSVWQLMVAWLIEITDYFNRMVSDQNPAALVVLAYWGASLVERAESCGERLSADAAIQALVQELQIELDLR
ncbi:uncharacterized protein N7483_002167 [Penicillium malachiteum]|uniref:uncharacterized protein n=1 Tax=Penicillium malachiteum TaxID=1324776 RepID=UPI0025481A9A|nr:uncharacterized protein N7483_002167 [Penicillium malachiteum]KAJ5737042.1 hypothetical protein N7483_002167 [Penicillium malachiteum]